ncbi:MAG: hypothetical protein U9P71_07125 [Campylobacterota bacterium]|nr:hypothetical protein [Campylobacterota bacterium]
MAYFKKVKVGDKVNGLVFGRGKIREVYPNSYYPLIVEFKNGYEVPFTEDGIPSWGNFDYQTLYYRDDIVMGKADFSPLSKVMTAKKIIRCREKGRLEVRMPSGMWENSNKCPKKYIENLLENERYHLFRKEEK